MFSTVKDIAKQSSCSEPDLVPNPAVSVGSTDDNAAIGGDRSPERRWRQASRRSRSNRSLSAGGGMVGSTAPVLSPVDDFSLNASSRAWMKGWRY